MDRNINPGNFIEEWLKQIITQPEFDQSIIESINQNLGGANNETINEAGLLKSLLEVSKRLVENDRN